MLHTYSVQFKKFAPKVWATYNDESSSDWARAQARVFKHTVNKDIPFAVIYNGLLRFANIMLGEKETPRARVMVLNTAASDSEAEDDTYEGEESEEDDDYVPRSSLRRDTELTNAIVPDPRPSLPALTRRAARSPSAPPRSPRARPQGTSWSACAVPDGRQTLAEQRLARSELNRTLFREFNTWYDAFEAEAAEDPERGAASAEERFSRHCAKILGRRTGLRQDLLESVVCGWLEAHLSR